jgi:hypothetical protein
LAVLNRDSEYGLLFEPLGGEGSEYSQPFQPALQRGGTHGVAVVSMQHQRLLPALTDLLADAGPADQIGCDGRVFSLGVIPGDDLAALDVDHLV